MTFIKATSTVQHEEYQHPEQGHHLNTEDVVDLLPATDHADNACIISNLKLQLETSKQTIISLQDELKKKDSDINVVTADVNKLKTAMVTLISEREADKKCVDQLQTDLEAVDNGCGAVVSEFKEQIKAVEGKLTEANSEV